MFFFSGFLKSSVVSAPSFNMHKTMIYNSTRFDITLQIFKYKKENFTMNTMYLVMPLAVDRKL